MKLILVWQNNYIERKTGHIHLHPSSFVLPEHLFKVFSEICYHITGLDIFKGLFIIDVNQSLLKIVNFYQLYTNPLTAVPVPLHLVRVKFS